MTLIAGDFEVREEILEFDGVFHTDWLKPVPWLPMTECNDWSDFVGVKGLGVCSRFGFSEGPLNDETTELD